MRRLACCALPAPLGRPAAAAPEPDAPAAGAREIREEAGLGARRLEHLQSVALAPCHLRHTTQVVRARDRLRDEQGMGGDGK